MQQQEAAHHAAEVVAARAREVSRTLAAATRQQKDAALRNMAAHLENHRAEILAANEADRREAASQGVPQNLLDRLRFDEGKIEGRRRSLELIAGLPDPVGRTLREETLPTGLWVRRVSVPLGVILMVYEARPHVTLNAGAFCLKAGSAAILRGGSEARRCNAVLGDLWREAALAAGLPAESVQVISGPHETIHELLELQGLIDLVIPRGGKGLIEAVARRSRIPVIKHYEGVCHVYLDGDIDLAAALDVVLDSKCLMPEVCNALETLLVDRSLAPALPQIVAALREAGITVKGCPASRAAVADLDPAEEADWRTEYLDMILSLRVVDGVDEAIDHINRYGSHHTDSIVTAEKNRAEQFCREVDSAVVLVNASTMFCDGQALGMGAEIGISTDKLHARGPMGLEELTSYKFVIHGRGHTMGKW